MSIRFIHGDATRPHATEGRNRIIAHGCNAEGKFGAGFAAAVAARWPHVRRRFVEWHSAGTQRLGDVQYVNVAPGLVVANCITQARVRRHRDDRPLDHDALRTALRHIGVGARKHGASVHMPRIGCGLAGGDWNVVEQIIREELADIDVFVYDPAS